MNFKFELIKNNKESCLKVFFSDGGCSISYKDQTIEDKIDDFFNYLDEYKSHCGMNEVSYEKREFIKHYIGKYKEENNIELLRIFGCSSLLMNYYLPADFISNQIKDSITNPTKEIFFDKLYIDWTDSLGPQPSIYYVSKEIVENESNSLIKLHELGFLGKLEVEQEDYSQSFYFVPFKISKISKWDYMVNKKLIDKIMEDREKSLSRIG